MIFMEQNKKPLSISQIRQYQTCPRFYYYNYKLRIREKTVTSFLSLGSAIDAALNAVLLDYQKNGSVSVDYKILFDEAWQKITIHGVEHSMPECTLVGYAKSDFVAELLQEDDIKYIKAKVRELCPDRNNDDIAELKTNLEESKAHQTLYPFTENEHKLLNLLNWLSVRRKCHLMLDAYVAEIIPNIEEVLEVQKRIDLKNGEGDEVVGYVDAIVRFKGESFYRVLDNKTSASAYSEDKAKADSQLTLYAFALGLSHVAFAVMLKSIKLNKEKVCSVCGYEAEPNNRAKTCTLEYRGKRCGEPWIEKVKPKAYTQIVKDEITSEVKNTVLETIEDINRAIKLEVYPRNLTRCNEMWGGTCPYLSICVFGQKECHHLVNLNIDNKNNN